MSTLIDATTLKTWLDNGEATLIDVRDATEYSEWRIPQASLIPVSDLKDNMEHIQRDGNKVVLHCLSGARSNNAYQQLSEAGTKNIYQLEGGINA